MRKNDAKWYSQILWNCFRIQFRPVHIRGSIPKTRVCFVTPPTFKSSVLTVELRHVTNFDISVRERKERKGLKNRQGYACESIRRRKDGWSWYWLAFADAGAEFSTSLPSFFHLHPLSLYIYIYTCITLHPAFFFLLRLASLPINILSASYSRSLFSFPPRYPLFDEPTFLFLPLSLLHLFPSYTSPVFIPLLLYLRIIYPSHSQFLCSSVWNRGSFSVSLSHPHRAERRGRKGMTRRTGLSNPLPRNDKTPVEGWPSNGGGTCCISLSRWAPFPSTFSIPRANPSRVQGRRREEMKLSEPKWGGESEWLESTGTRWRSRKWRCATRKAKEEGGVEEYRGRRFAAETG